MKGIYFFVVASIEELRKLSKDNILRDQNKYLLQGDIKCTFLSSKEIF
jgi:hypothetical protein